MTTVIIDVRTPKEYRDNGLPGAINIPSNSCTIDDFKPYQDHHITLVCESGNRASKVSTFLLQEGFHNVSLLNRHMGQIADQTEASSWTVDRQFRLALAIIIGISLSGIYFGFTFFWSLLIIVFCGLLYSAVTDNCYLKMLISMMPWNRSVQEPTLREVQSIVLRS